VEGSVLSFLKVTLNIFVVLQTIHGNVI